MPLLLPRLEGAAEEAAAAAGGAEEAEGIFGRKSFEFAFGLIEEIGIDSDNENEILKRQERKKGGKGRTGGAL